MKTFETPKQGAAQVLIHAGFSISQAQMFSHSPTLGKSNLKRTLMYCLQRLKFLAKTICHYFLIKQVVEVSPSNDCRFKILYG